MIPNLMQGVQSLADDLYCLTLFPARRPSAKLRRFHRQAELTADLCALLLASQALWTGFQNISLIQQEIFFKRYELQQIEDAEIDDIIISEISELRRERSKTKWSMVQSTCELVFAGQ